MRPASDPWKCRSAGARRSVGPLQDALRPDVDPRAGRHLPEHHQAFASRSRKCSHVGHAGHEVGVGDQHAGDMRCVRSTPTGFPDCTRSVSSSPRSRRHWTIASKHGSSARARRCRRRRSARQVLRVLWIEVVCRACAGPLPGAIPAGSSGARGAWTARAFRSRSSVLSQPLRGRTVHDCLRGKRDGRRAPSGPAGPRSRRDPVKRAAVLAVLRSFFIRSRCT